MNLVRVLEISRVGLFCALLPKSTTWIRWGGPLVADEPNNPETLSVKTLIRTLILLTKREFDLIVLPAIHPEHSHGQSGYKNAAKSALRSLADQQLSAKLLSILGLSKSRKIILDISDDRHLCETALRLFPDSERYFKRELDLGKSYAPGILEKLRPIPLFVPNEERIPAKKSKIYDVFFSGALCSPARRKAVAEALKLEAQGIATYIPDAPLPYDEFLDALSRSWLVLSPEGLGWDCYRHYEACLAGAVPVINEPSYRRRLFLQEGSHSFYYKPEGSQLTDCLTKLLSDKQKLTEVAEAGRRHVLAHHTRAAIARQIASDIGL